MVNTRRKKDSRKNRKRILRRMKSLMKVIEAHGRNYRDLLAESWEQSGFSEAEAQVVLDRIDNILDQLPQAVRQAHEPIIGGRKVASADKHRTASMRRHPEKGCKNQDFGTGSNYAKFIHSHHPF
jgi:hypothetical protein